MYTFNGKIPIMRAIELYKELLDREIRRAEEELRKNTKKEFIPIKLGLFRKIIVPCVSSNTGREKEIYFRTHELHYGLLDNVEMCEDDTMEDYWMRSFSSRNNGIWIRTNIDTSKNHGGDGKGWKNTACSPFRQKQIDLASEGKYLLDLSYFTKNNETGKYMYIENIKLCRKLREKKIYLWHQYDLIPNESDQYNMVNANEGEEIVGQ
jgi:hypothetical protein